MDLQTLISRVRTIISEPHEDAVTNIEITAWLNDALDVISERKVFSATARMPLIEDQKEYVLPGNFIDFCSKAPVKIQASNKEYGVEIITEPEADSFLDSENMYTSFSTGGYYVMGQRENKLRFINFTPGENDNDKYILLRYYRYHEYMVADTDTPYRLLRTQHLCLIDYAVARFHESDNELGEAKVFDDKFFRYWLPRIEEHANAQKAKQKRITRVSNLRGGFFGIASR